MGQGHYHGILYGVQEVQELEKGLYWVELLDKVSGGRIRSQYESEPYLGLYIAISDPALDWYKAPVDLCYKVIPVDEIETILAPHIEEAQRIWQLCQEEAKKYNATLPDGKLLLVYDYD